MFSKYYLAKSFLVQIPFMDNSNKKFPRAISAHVMRPLEKKNDYFIHNVYLSSRKRLGNHNAFRKKL